MTNHYYVYAYIDQYDKTPYYIGKGMGSRAYDKHHDLLPIPKNTNNILILADNLTENESFQLERELIKQFGRADNKTGILLNRSDGRNLDTGKEINRMRGTLRARCNYTVRLMQVLGSPSI